MSAVASAVAAGAPWGGPELPYFSAALIAHSGEPAELAARMRRAYAAGLDGVEVPLRSSIQRAHPFRAFDTMPAYSEAHGLFVTKIGAVIPQADPAAKSVHAVVVAFSGTSGRPLGIFDGDAVTNLKCMAVTAMVTDLCAVHEAASLCLIGSGVQALGQLRAVAAVRPLQRVAVYARNAQRLAAFVDRCRTLYPAIRFEVCQDAEQACRDADIVSTATTASTPLLPAHALQRPGLHINCFGNHTCDSREIPREVLTHGSTVIVEDLQTAIEEAGALHRSAIPLARLGELDPDALKRGRTVFSSTGHALLDLLAVDYLVERLHLHPPSTHTHSEPHL